MSTGMDDHGLVIGVQHGDERAFEALYRRYHRRVAAYVLGMVKDHGRAEDVTQEVFLSALRRMRNTERPIAFEPWIYAIARNACIDEFRRAQRTQEVPDDVDEAGALVGSAPTPDAALVTKLELDQLRGAFGGLSDHHHEALVLRELEGLSHREIGERMGLSRTAVESTLARARKRLAEEYEELATGARCLQIRELIASAAEVALGSREEHRLARHVAHCQPCRRQALAAGIDSSVLTYVPLRRRAARKIAALLPFPALHVGWAKPAAVVAVVVAGAGATGVSTKLGGERERASTAEVQPTQERSPRPAVGSGGGAEPVGSLAGGRESGALDAGRARVRANRELQARRGGPSGGTRPPAPSDSPHRGAPPPGGEGETARSGGGGGDGGPGQGGGGDAGTPAPSPNDTPAGNSRPPRRTVATGVANTVNNTLDGVNQTLRGVTGGVNETLAGVDQTLRGSPQGLTETVQGVTETVRGVTDGLGGTLQGGTDGLDETLDGVLGGLLGPRR